VSHPKIGAFVLETLTTGMYTKSLDCLREYVQNSADSIRRIEQQGLLVEGEGRITVRVDPGSRVLSVRDNGFGVENSRVEAVLLNVGMSDKELGIDAGFRGIGRLAGIAYCEELTFRTSFPGEAVTTAVSFDCNGIRRAVSPTLRQVEELSDVIADNSTVSTDECDPERHFFEVSMGGISDTTPEFLDWSVLEEYLSAVAPVPFDAHRFLFAPVISKWAKDHRLPIPTVTLVVESQDVKRQVFKRYRTRYKTQRKNYDVEIKDVRFLPEDPTPDCPYWLWYGVSELAGMLDDDLAAGLVFRKHNIMVGDPSRVADLFAEVSKSNRRFNAYYIGEIHIIDRDVIPNARRDGFEDTNAWVRVKSDLHPFIQERCEDIRVTSEARNRPTVKVVATASKVIEEVSGILETGLVSDKERRELLKKVRKEHSRLQRALENRRSSSDVSKLKPLSKELVRIKERLANGKPDIVRKLPSSLDKKQRRLVATVLQVLQSVLDDSDYRRAKDAILRKLGMKKSR